MAQDIAEGLGAADYGSQTMLLVMWGQPAHVAYNDTIFIWRMAAGEGVCVSSTYHGLWHDRVRGFFDHGARTQVWQRNRRDVGEGARRVHLPRYSAGWIDSLAETHRRRANALWLGPRRRGSVA